MMKMVLSEYRKLFKRPISWLLLVVIVIMTLYQCHGIYHRTILKQYGNPREIVQEVDGIAYFRQADQVLHQYRGPASQEMYACIKADYHDMLDTYYLNAKPLNDDEIPYYDTDALLAVYTGIYQNQPNIHFNLDVISADDGGKSDEEALEWYGWLLDRDAAFNEVYHLKGYPEIKAQLASVYEAREIIFDSTIPNNLVLDAFDQMNFFYLLILSFLLANLFSQEKTTHMDALINSSPRGYRQTAATKCWCAIGLAVIVCALHAFDCAALQRLDAAGAGLVFVGNEYGWGLLYAGTLAGVIHVSYADDLPQYEYAGMFDQYGHADCFSLLPDQSSIAHLWTDGCLDGSADLYDS